MTKQRKIIEPKNKQNKQTQTDQRLILVVVVPDGLFALGNARLHRPDDGQK